MKKKTEYQLLRDDFFHVTRQLGLANKEVRELRELREVNCHEYNILLKENKRLREENEMLNDELQIYKEEEI
ncbi:hypothetical protein [Bacillus toyonensis]|uniref:hypothetical protein n=1 Tax=Bacillus toyonensis TaxID=155322 RepID=UPI000BFBC4DE|nr:hypothetical protein [Bacillus toyonensis]PHC14398.1 hypothetical protein COF03_25140 [Bacillus toyonensis]